MGSNIKIAADISNSVGLGNNSTVTSSNEVSVGSDKIKRKITNVADGEVSEISTDAINGSQLYKAMQSNTGIKNLKNDIENVELGLENLKTDATNTPTYIMQDEVERLSKENHHLKSVLNLQNDKLQKQDERIRNLEKKLEMFIKNK